MLKALLANIDREIWQVQIAYHRPYSLWNEGSVPFTQMLFRKPQIRQITWLDLPCFELGCWLPELEFTHYWPTSLWKKLIDQHDAHIVVSGNSLSSVALLKNNTKYTAWIASDWHGDRQHRVERYPWFRKQLNKLLIKSIATRFEQDTLNGAQRLYSLSAHTESQLKKVAGENCVTGVLPYPIDTNRFSPNGMLSDRPSIGFVGRFSDPRKNIELLIRSFAKVVHQQEYAELILIGDRPTLTQKKLIETLDIVESVTFFPYLEQAELIEQLQKLHVFVLPSHQEGLCIAALEAMSCAVPVISTNSGGPQDYIKHNENGILLSAQSDLSTSVAVMAATILELMNNPESRQKIALRARNTIIERYSIEAVKPLFKQMLDVESLVSK